MLKDQSEVTRKVLQNEILQLFNIETIDTPITQVISSLSLTFYIDLAIGKIFMKEKNLYVDSGLITVEQSQRYYKLFKQKSAKTVLLTILERRLGLNISKSLKLATNKTNQIEGLIVLQDLFDQFHQLAQKPRKIKKKNYSKKDFMVSEDF